MKRKNSKEFIEDYIEGIEMVARFNDWIGSQYGTIKTFQKENELDFDIACLISFSENRTHTRINL